MNIVLHGNGREIQMHHTDTDQTQHKITVPVKEWIGSKNKWSTPVAVDKSLVYRFAYQEGSYYHYQLEADKKIKLKSYPKLMVWQFMSWEFGRWEGMRYIVSIKDAVNHVTSKQS